MNRYLKPMAGLGIALGLAAWSAAPALAEIAKSPEVAQTGTLAIANTLDFAPFEYLDADGQQTGIIIELAGEVAKLVGAKLDIQRTPFPSMIPGLSAGRFKIAWETFSANEDRLKQVDFVMFLKAGVAAIRFAASASASRPALLPTSSSTSWMPSARPLTCRRSRSRSSTPRPTSSRPFCPAASMRASTTPPRPAISR